MTMITQLPITMSNITTQTKSTNEMLSDLRLLARGICGADWKTYKWFVSRSPRQENSADRLARIATKTLRVGPCGEIPD